MARERHGQAYRQAAQVWYSSHRWKKVRARQLLEKPLCAMCLERGIVVMASIADHKIPHKGNETLFWGNELQSLCKRCHDSDKKIIESGGKIKRYSLDGWLIED